MNPLTHEWVAKVEGDFRTARREVLVADGPNHDAVCYHAQQCVEKYFKALLVEAAMNVPRTHNLAALLEALLPVYPSCDSIGDNIDALADMAVEVRYPGVTSDLGEAQEALDIALSIRQTCRNLLELA